MKKCAKCQLEKATNDFGKNCSETDGLSAYCKKCAKAYRNQYWNDNRDRKNRDRRELRQGQLELSRSKDRKRYQRDKERIQERSAKYYANNPDPKRASAKQWAEANSERVRELNRIHQLSRRARKIDQFIEDVDPNIVYEMHGGMCGICEDLIQGKFHVDHVIPLSKGGMHGYANVQPAHKFCNLSKGAKVEVR
jgi:5-methylcytosine-specific restriction endonuclease McrA